MDCRGRAAGHGPFQDRRRAGGRSGRRHRCGYAGDADSADGDADEHTNTHKHADGDGHAHRDAHSCPDANAYADLYTNGYAYGDFDAYANLHADIHTDADAVPAKLRRICVSGQSRRSGTYHRYGQAKRASRNTRGELCGRFCAGGRCGYV